MAPRQGSCGFAVLRKFASPRRQGGRAPLRMRGWLPALRIAWALGLTVSLLGLAFAAATVTAEQTLRGTSGKDVLRGDAGPNWISGGRSADRIFGRAGNDVLRGGTAPDLLDGGSGDDSIYGDEASDRLEGGPGADRL